MTDRQTEHPTQSVAPGAPATEPGPAPDPALVDPERAMMAGRNASTDDDGHEARGRDVDRDR